MAKFWKLHKTRTIMGIIFGLIVGIIMYFVPQIRIYPTTPLGVALLNGIVIGAFAIFWFNFGD